ncbi:MAG TPA: hypothetical protein VG651_01505 [Stellaceae bacterium]|nr:hypothetical protein [Stellaceae bacterium]
MAGELTGITRDQRDQLQSLALQLSRLWADLSKAADERDEVRVAEIRTQIDTCRAQVERIRRTGTRGSA